MPNMDVPMSAEPRRGRAKGGGATDHELLNMVSNFQN